MCATAELWRKPDRPVFMPKDPIMPNLKMKDGRIIIMRFPHTELELESTNICLEVKSIWGEGEVCHILFRVNRLDRRVCIQIPHHHFVVIRCRRQLAAVRRELHSSDQARVAFQRVQLFSCARVPHHHFLVA
jgi:hypothetical protein